MTALLCIGWAVTAAVIVWGLMLIWARIAMADLRKQARQEIRYWQQETTRARDRAAQIAREAATRAEGWKEGRDDVVAIMPMITAHAARAHPGDSGASVT